MENLRISSNLMIGISLLIVFTSSNYFLFTWENSIGYFIMIMLASFLGGVIMVSIDKSLKINAIAFVIACFMFIGLQLLPIFVLGEVAVGEIDTMITLVSTRMARYIILSFPASIFMCLIGAFSGAGIT